MTESGLGVLASQCPDRCLPDKTTLIGETAAWRHEGNKHHAKADWQFTAADASVKLKSLYSRFE